MTTDLETGGAREGAAELVFEIKHLDMRSDDTLYEQFAALSLLARHGVGRMPLRTINDLYRVRKQEEGKDFFIAQDEHTGEIVGVATGSAVIDEVAFEDTEVILTTEEYDVHTVVVDPRYSGDLVEVALTATQKDYAKKCGHKVLHGLNGKRVI